MFIGFKVNILNFTWQCDFGNFVLKCELIAKLVQRMSIEED